MPLYETVMQEKPPVVLEIGSAYTKIGFAAEGFPRFIIPSEVYSSKIEKVKKLFDYEQHDEIYDHMVDFFQKIFFTHALVSPKDRKVVLVESIFNVSIIRETIAKVLFKHFEISSILFLPTHLVVLNTLAIDSGMVVDFGFKEVTMIPVFSGIQLFTAFHAQPYGSEAIHEEIRNQLIENGFNKDYLTEKILEDIKIRCCFVTTFERSQQYRKGETPDSLPPDVDYSISGKEIIKIPGKLRETAMEIMFVEDNDFSGLPYQILETILQCPIDIRKMLIENIVLIGGTSMIIGLLPRLKAELLYLLKSHLYKDKLFSQTVKFHKIPVKQNFAAWLGGSIYAGTDLVLSKSLTKEMYSKYPRVPDWSNLDDNRHWG